MAASAGSAPIGWLEAYWDLAPAPGLIIFLACLLLFLRMAFVARRQLLLRFQGVSAEGQVLRLHKRLRSTQKEKWQTRNLQSEAQHYDFLVDYTFRDAEAKTVEGSAPVDPELWESLQVGATVTVRFVPSDPAINRVGQDLTAAVGVVALVLMLVGGLGALGGLVTIGGDLLAVRHLRALAADGVRAEGVVDDEWLDVGLFLPLIVPELDQVTVSFATRDGARQTVTRRVARRHGVGGVGDKVEVLYAPDDPAGAVLAAQALARP